MMLVSDQILLYIGCGVMGCAAIGLPIHLLTAKLKKTRLTTQLEKEYGEKQER